MIELGKKAPDFTLADQDGEKVALKDLRGSWVVLYFYPKDDTPGCTTEACEFTAGIEDFRGLDARVLGCSPDSPESHRRFIAKHDLKITLLSDPQRAVMTPYGGSKDGRTVRSTVIIAPDGKVAHHYPQVRPAGHADELKKKLAELKASS